MVDKMASATRYNWNPFEPAFLSTGSETTTPCSLCLLLENLANAHGYPTSHECLRKAYAWYLDTIICKFPPYSLTLKLKQLSGKYAKLPRRCCGADLETN
jgi:hypothetical protein